MGAAEKLEFESMKHLSGEITIKQASKAADGKVIIEGFANKAVIDRGNDLIPPEAWELENFKINPIILFNHDKNLPIGKATDFKATEEGLVIKAEISNSDDPLIKRVRDLISEGILKTFSVGFDPHDSFKANEDGVNVPDRAELLEVSVVTIPMNQNSDFSVVGKYMKEHGKDWLAKMSLEELQEFVEASEAEKAKKPADAVEDEEENDEAADEKNESEGKDEKNEFQECVEGKIPKLIEEGKDRDQAIAQAIAMCREQGKCAYTPDREDYVHMLSVADDAVSKQAEQGDDVSDATFPAGKTTDDTDIGNPHLDVAKAQLAMLGSMNTLLKELTAGISKMNDTMETLSLKMLEGETPEPAPVEEPKEMPESDEDEDEAEDEEEKAFLDRRKKMLENFGDRLSKIKV